MVRTHDRVVPLPPEVVGCPCPPIPPQPTPITPVISVSSVNGMYGDVVLKDLILGELRYNGADEIIITLEDLGLKTAVIYRGMKTKAFIDNITDVEEGDLL